MSLCDDRAGCAALLLLARGHSPPTNRKSWSSGCQRGIHRRKRRLRRRNSQRQEPGVPGPVGAPPDFDVVSTGDESRNQSSIFILNGNVSQQNSFGHVFRFRLTPKRTGKSEIPAPSATIDGKTVSGRSMSLNVITPEAQDLVVLEIKDGPRKGLPHAAVRGHAPRAGRPLPDYPDPTLWFRLAAALRTSTSIGGSICLQDCPATTRPGGSRYPFPRAAVGSRSTTSLHGAARFSTAEAGGLQPVPGSENRKGMDGHPVDHFVYELKRNLTAEKAGTYALGPAIVKGSFVAGMEGSSYTGRRPVAVGPKVSVEVRKSRFRGPRHSAAESAITAWRRPPAPPRFAWATRSRSRSTSNAGKPADRWT